MSIQHRQNINSYTAEKDSVVKVTDLVGNQSSSAQGFRGPSNFQQRFNRSPDTKSLIGSMNGTLLG